MLPGPALADNTAPARSEPRSSFTGVRTFTFAPGRALEFRVIAGPEAEDPSFPQALAAYCGERKALAAYRGLIPSACHGYLALYDQVSYNFELVRVRAELWLAPAPGFAATSCLAVQLRTIPRGVPVSALAVVGWREVAVVGGVPLPAGGEVTALRPFEDIAGGSLRAAGSRLRFTAKTPAGVQRCEVDAVTLADVSPSADSSCDGEDEEWDFRFESLGRPGTDILVRADESGALLERRGSGRKTARRVTTERRASMAADFSDGTVVLCTRGELVLFDAEFEPLGVLFAGGFGRPGDAFVCARRVNSAGDFAIIFGQAAHKDDGGDDSEDDDGSDDSEDDDGSDDSEDDGSDNGRAGAEGYTIFLIRSVNPGDRV